MHDPPLQGQLLVALYGSNCRLLLHIHKQLLVPGSEAAGQQ
jgi:hypothetical protein